MTRTGWFESRDAMLNQLHRNVVWGMRGNFLDVPTDCPQRDERLGWTGDIQVFSPTATYLFDTAGFLTSWLADLAAEQDSPAGYRTSSPTSCVPNSRASRLRRGAMLRPWCLGCCGSEPATAASSSDSSGACAHGSTMSRSVAGDDLIWRGGVQYGDWLDPTAPADDPFQAKSDPDVVATAHFARSADIVARAADVILNDEDAALSYGRLADASAPRSTRSSSPPPAVSCPTLRPSTRWRWSGTCCRTRVRAPLPASGSQTSCAQAVSGSRRGSSEHR